MTKRLRQGLRRTLLGAPAWIANGMIGMSGKIARKPVELVKSTERGTCCRQRSAQAPELALSVTCGKRSGAKRLSAKQPIAWMDSGMLGASGRLVLQLAEQV